MARSEGESYIYMVDSEETGEDGRLHTIIETMLDCSFWNPELDALPLNGMTIYPSKHPLDKKYPHRCHNKNCRMPLSFRELLDRNARIVKFARGNARYVGRRIFYNYKEYKHLKKLWKCKFVKFLCCQCYDNRNNEIIKEQLDYGK